MNIDEKRLYELKQELNSLLQGAAHFGLSNNHFTAKDFADRLDELIVIRIKQALGSAMTKWKTTDFGSYVEVMPQTDAKEHLAGDECWCNPETERKPGSRPLISHNEVSDLPTEGLEPSAGHSKAQ